MFASASSGRSANLRRRKASVPSTGRLYIQDSRPSANMFLARSDSFRDRPVSARAPWVSRLMGTGCTWKRSSSPLSRETGRIRLA